MSSTLSIENEVGLLTQRQRTALIALLADEDPAIYQVVRSKIVSYGRSSVDWLRPYTLSSDPVLRRRALEIINHFARQAADERFLAFCLKNGEDLEIEQGALLLAQTHYPDANREAYQALFDHYAGELRERLDLKAETDQLLGAINHYLFDKLGFAGNKKYGDQPENCYLNWVVDNRTGNPISLCAVYLFIARRLHLPVAGIGLPGHFICRFQSARKEVFIDPFNRGRFLTKADCIKYLVQTNHGLQEGYLSPVSPSRMLLRMCANLHQIYLHLEQMEEAARVQRYIFALAKG
jgi:regulator of sirC expression with transglutaminase-like and TPR domain